MRHPLHPAIVHFPVACWLLAVAADVAGLWLGEGAWRWSSGLLVAGCAMALPALLAGLLELRQVPEGAPMRDAYAHMTAMLMAFVLFAARLLLWQEQGHPLPPGLPAVLLDVAGAAALVTGGWFGGRLVYGHGVGRGRP